MFFKTGTVMWLLAFSFSSCTAALNNRCSRSAPAPSQSTVEAPNSPDQGSAALAPTPAPVEAEPQAPEIRSGKAILASGGKYRIFVHRVTPDICPGGIDARIVFYDLERAVQDYEACRRVEPKTLRPGALKLAEFDDTVLLYEQKVYDLESLKTQATVVICSGGVDSGGRAIGAVVKRDLSNGSTSMRIDMKGSGPTESLNFPASVETKNKLTIYQSGQPGTQPYLSIGLGNFNGLTAFLSFDLLFPGPSRLSRKETNLNLPNCYIP